VFNIYICIYMYAAMGILKSPKLVLLVVVC